LKERYLLSTVAAELARVVYSKGRYEDAERLSETAEDLAAEDDIASQGLWRSARSKVLARRGEHERALALGEEAVKLLEQTDAAMIRTEILTDFAEALRLTGRSAEAEAALELADKILAAKINGEDAETPATVRRLASTR
jgi:tetratricopeptide (TPR) repeat protein